MSLPLSALRRSSLAFSSLITLPIRAKNEVADEQQPVPSENSNTIVKSDSMEEINLNDYVIPDPTTSSPTISSSSLPFSFSKIRRASLVVSEFFTPPTISSFPKVKKQIPPPLSLDGENITSSLPPLTTTATLKKSKKNEKEGGVFIIVPSVPSSRIEKQSHFAKQNVLDSPDLCAQ